MSENKKVENDFGSQTEEDDQKTESISKPSDEELDPSCSEEMHLKGADTGDGIVVSQLVESFKNLELPSSVPIDDYLQKYNMSHEKRGEAIIFNHYQFNPHLKLPRREGTKKDVERLKAVFKKHSFHCRAFNDSIVSDIFFVIEEAIAKVDHSNADCVAVVILTHGEKEGALYARDGPYKLSTLVEMITPDKCLSLAGKPKLFFIQACRGKNEDRGTTLSADSSPDQNRSIKIPCHADFLIAQATTPGYIAIRYEEEGSLFIRAIEEVLSKEKSHTTSFLTLMTEVIRNVALKYQNNPGDLKQVPSITTTLTKELVLVNK